MGITWQPELAIGITEIDRQHEELFTRFDLLLAACDEGKERQEIAALFQFLTDYVTTHFRAEESLQRESGFPGYANHREQHRQFAARLEGLKWQLAKEDASLPIILQTNHLLLDWLINHIAREDQKIGSHLDAA